MEDALIRKLSIGPDLAHQLHIAVGARMGGLQITHIIPQDTPNTYDVYIGKDNNDFYKWKTVSGMPVIVEYDLRA